MTLVVLPFRYDDLAVFDRTLEIAAHHPAVTQVMCVGDLPPQPGVMEAAARTAQSSGTLIEVIRQERIGTLRAGKGDAVLTGLRRFVEAETADRVHFYDADIRSFSTGWIDAAESALNGGVDVAKLFFHRSATDAQITWHITKAGAAMLWPASGFPDVRQPLGGEFALTRNAATTLWESPIVQGRSDWGIDTVLSFEILRRGLSMHEVFIPEGKEHGYYGSLTDLWTMLCECLDALQRLAGFDLPPGDQHRIDEEGAVPDAIRHRIAYDIDSTTSLVDGDLTADAQIVVEAHPALAPAPPEAWDDRRWLRAMRSLLHEFRLGDPGWEQLAFRAWVSRVLFHTSTNVPLGYGAAMAALQSAVARFRRNST